MNLDQLLDAPLVVPVPAPAAALSGVWAPPLLRPAMSLGEAGLVAPVSGRSPARWLPTVQSPEFPPQEHSSLPEPEGDRQPAAWSSAERASSVARDRDFAPSPAPALRPSPVFRPAPEPLDQELGGPTWMLPPSPVVPTPPMVEPAPMSPMAPRVPTPPTPMHSPPSLVSSVSPSPQVLPETVIERSEVQRRASAPPAPVLPKPAWAEGSVFPSENRPIIGGNLSPRVVPNPVSGPAPAPPLVAEAEPVARTWPAAPRAGRTEEGPSYPPDPVAEPLRGERRPSTEVLPGGQRRPGLPTAAVAPVAPGPGPAPTRSSPVVAAGRAPRSPAPLPPEPMSRVPTPPPAVRVGQARSPLPARPVASPPTLPPVAASPQARTILPIPRNPIVIQNTSSLVSRLPGLPARPLPPPAGPRLAPPPAAGQRSTLPTPAPDPVEVHIGHFEVRPPPAPVVTQRASASHRIPVAPPGLGRW